eukprot:TRINITY_DN7046_c0_g1_i1.p1 TRINITY_DN7046_c0_g1~~TRINITY_DN7046_c0_g1_i1.p1  ORF type:complete len:345 (-),score=90.47 TRINITY_DN7046_c0_g1_i1:48-944(-)
MIDFIFVIDDESSKWHTNNYAQHPDHYSTFASLLLRGGQKSVDASAEKKSFGSPLVSFIQRAGAQIYYNTDVPVFGRRIKYGVISISDLCKDLEEWTTLYVSGRMQKPVLTIKSDERVEKSSLINLNHALRTALLTLPEEFTDKDLFTAITGISYAGDVRMKFAENPKKIQNIVTGSYTQFQDLYSPLLDSHFKDVLSYDRKTNKIKQDLSENHRVKLMEELPSNLQRHILKDFGPNQSKRDCYLKLVSQNQVGKAVLSSASKIVKSTSFAQTAKGLATAGVRKSFYYSLAKVLKAMK